MELAALQGFMVRRALRSAAIASEVTLTAIRRPDLVGTDVLPVMMEIHVTTLVPKVATVLAAGKHVRKTARKGTAIQLMETVTKLAATPALLGNSVLNVVPLEHTARTAPWSVAVLRAACATVMGPV